MRTKALLCGAALLVAGVATSLAQSNVYSLNVVGYINVPLTNGLQMVANQLDKDGTGVNNSLYTVIGTNVANLTRVYAFDPNTAAYAFSTFNAGSLTWTGNTNAVNLALQPGKGVFIQYPNVATPTNITIVGEVLQGSLTNTPFVGFAITSSKVPQAGLLGANLGYTPASLDRVFRYDASIQNYSASSTYNAGSGLWNGPGEPNLRVAEAFWLNGHASSAWVRNFTVQ